MASVLPVSWNSCFETPTIGLMLVRFGCGMREPVTTISPTVVAGAAAPASAAASTVAIEPLVGEVLMLLAAPATTGASVTDVASAA
jgi:hypothetical protein